ncbi:MAG: ABC transporter ATP-binding protein [Patescibacteria group bacterium]|nr:ABC transporter ATP-binding protein [Patescibacteria group bacterium]
MGKNKKNKKSFWKDFWRFMKEHQKKLISIMIVTFFLELFRLIGPYILKHIIDRIIEFRAEDISVILFLIALMFIVDQTNSILFYFNDKRVLKFEIGLHKSLFIRAQKKIVFLPLSYHERENTGNKITKITHGIDRIIELIGSLYWDVVPSMSQLLLTFSVLLFVDYRLALSMAFFAPMFIWVSYDINKKLRPVRNKRYRDNEKASGKMVQSIFNINTVKSFVQEKREVADYRKIRTEIAQNEENEWVRFFKTIRVRNLIIDLGRSMTLLIGVYLVYNKLISVGTLVFVITLSEKSYFSLYRVSRIYDRIEEGREAVDRFIDLENEKSDLLNKKNAIKPKSISGKIVFKDVYFSYNNSELKALKNINLKINEGCVTALVGPSGGGKTTIARMIYRHYDPQKGVVSIDGVDLRDYDIYSFRKFISIVPQEVEIFSDSVENNISYAKPSAGREEMLAAAKIANAHEFIEKLSKGYKTEVGERGIKLSGGQRQRIGIARAILANPRILIFDEATSSLDSQSERLIQDAMDKISRGRTVIIIAHRLSTIKKADKIIVLENGGVVQEGSHYELSKNTGGLYSKLIKLQELGELD